MHHPSTLARMHEKRTQTQPEAGDDRTDREWKLEQALRDIHFVVRGRAALVSSDVFRIEQIIQAARE